MIKFSNPGEIDILALTTLGVNAKSGDSPIGYFGTGLKYAIAVLLRNGQHVEIWSGLTKCEFTVEPATIRGKDFGFIYMTERRDHYDPVYSRLGFTTELGKNWTLAHAYRELHSNCLDEGGSGGVETGTSHRCAPKAGETNIFVAGAEFAQIHVNRHEFLLDATRKCLHHGASIDIYLGRSKTVYYRGIAAGELEREALYTYNITSAMELTEDRTIAKPWRVLTMISAEVVAAAFPPELTRDILLASKDTNEQKLDFTYITPSSQFLDICARLDRDAPMRLNLTALACLFKARGDDPREYTLVRLSPELQAELDGAIAWCKEIGFPVDAYPIRVASTLGDTVYGRARNGTIYIARMAFEPHAWIGLREILIEEYIHLCYAVPDESREMQTWLLRHLIRVGHLAHAKQLPAIEPPPALDDVIPF